MSWTCPVCEKEFDKINQFHKCETAEIETLLRNDANLILLFDHLLLQMYEMGEMRLSTSKKAISLSNRVAFLLVYPKRNGLELRLFLDTDQPEGPIRKVSQYTKSKFVHWVNIQTETDMEVKLLRLIQRAWQLAA
ncbi:MAG: DUF5655 domain-containing protein [Bacteroidota bacterium]